MPENAREPWAGRATVNATVVGAVGELLPDAGRSTTVTAGNRSARPGWARKGGHPLSWSMFRFREHWAHAHDVQQETFMALAAMYVEANPTYRAVPWLREWQAFWLRSIGRQPNGL